MATTGTSGAGQSATTGQCRRVRFCTSSTSISTALRCGPASSFGATTTALRRSISAPRTVEPSSARAKSENRNVTVSGADTIAHLREHLLQAFLAFSKAHEDRGDDDPHDSDEGKVRRALIR